MFAIRAISGARTTLPHLKNSLHPSLVLQNLRLNQCYYSYNNNESLQKRSLHTSQVSRDMEGAFRAIGAGVAITGVIGPGIGIGIVFGNFCNAVSRNPSVSNQLFPATIMGAAFCEALGLFAMLISFMALFT